MAELLEHYTILGSGIDGMVITPPFPCLEPIDPPIEPRNYVGKITYAKKNITNIYQIYEKVKSLPNELDKILYDKEIYLCDIDEKLLKQINQESSTLRQFHSTQMILPLIQGEDLVKVLEFSQYEKYKFTIEEWGKLLVSYLEFYKHLTYFNELGFFHNDINLSNIMYDRDTNHFTLIDFDTLSIGTSKARKNIMNNIRMDDLRFARMGFKEILGYMSDPESVSEEAYVLEEEKVSPLEYSQMKSLLESMDILRYHKKKKFTFITVPSHEEMIDMYLNKSVIIQNFTDLYNTYNSTGGYLSKRKTRSMKRRKRKKKTKLRKMNKMRKMRKMRKMTKRKRNQKSYLKRNQRKGLTKKRKKYS